MKGKNILILKEIMTTVLEIEGDIEFSNLEQANQLKWDSLAIVNLVVAVESDFGIKIKNEEIEHFISFNKIVSVLESKGL